MAPEAKNDYHKAGFFSSLLVGIGLSSGMLGQWDQAVSELQTAKNLAKDDKAIDDDLKWAKSGQKAAAKAKQPAGKAPAWN